MCASPLSSSSDIVAGGATPQGAAGTLTDADALLSMNVNSGRVVRRTPADAAITHLAKSGRYVCAGTAQGTIQLRDPRTLQLEHRLTAHHGGLIDMQAEGHLIYSLGWTLRQGHRVAEPFIKVHDVRSMQALVPIPMTAPGGPSRLAIHPKRASLVAVATPQSQFQVVDTHSPGQSQFFSLPSGAYITSLAFSTSAEELAFGESDGSLRLWSNAAEGGRAVRFNAYPTAPLALPDYAPPPPVIEWRADTPLSRIGMPHYDKRLLSAPDYDTYWSDASPLFTMRAPLDEQVLSQLQDVQGVGFAPLPAHLRGQRNRLVGSDEVLGRYDRSGKLKRSALTRLRGGRGARRVNVQFHSERAASNEDGDPWTDVAGGMPAYYALMTIQYSRFGVEDFDFGYYNKTAYSGLETNIRAAYANSYLQALHYARPFREFAKRHILLSCTANDCLLCEAGFLFRMLEDARGTNCQATNLLRVLGSSRKAATLGLLDGSENAQPYTQLVQSLNHFLLDHASQQALRTGAALELPPAQFALCANPTAWTLHTYSMCSACGHSTMRQQLSHVVDLLYPSVPGADLATLLGPSIRRETLAKGTCRYCRTFATHCTWRTVPSADALPAVLSVNACVHSAAPLAHWMPRAKTRGFVAPRLAMRVAIDGRVAATTVDEGDAELAACDAEYRLRALVIQVQGGYDAPHLCTYVRGPGDDADEYVLFNDFLVRTVPESEVLHFGESWKIPALLVWERVDAAATARAAQLAEAASTLQPDYGLLTRDENMAMHRVDARTRHEVLSLDEIPQPGTLVAIDAEFVALALEELELFSDGTRSLIEPSRLALARVSVLRGEGPREGIPFIDDHIYTTEPVVDYLTQFSGIHLGDLDPEHTRSTLVPHKVAYKKLRMLVDLGCRFIGHGLAKDFRIISAYRCDTDSHRHTRAATPGD